MCACIVLSRQECDFDRDLGVGEAELTRKSFH